MIHLNGHKLCVIDTETTGLNPFKHDIWQIAVVPLDFDLNVDVSCLPFDVEMQPRNLDDIDYNYMSRKKVKTLMNEAFDPNIALDLFIEWLERLNLPEGKRIMPLAHNWCFDKPFIEKWLGEASYNLYFDGRYRDLMPVSLFINDCDDNHATPYHFPKNKLSYICAQIGVEIDHDMLHTALYDAIKTAEAYKKLCHLTQCFA